MGLFDKKYCDICGEKIGFLGNRKLADGNMCKDCAKKLSPWFDERRETTVEGIKEQLVYREQNLEEVRKFHVTHELGVDMGILLDHDTGKFMVTNAKNLEKENPDVLNISDVTGCRMHIGDHKREIYRQNSSGERVSYNPPRYEYSYHFHIYIQINHPYIDEIHFELTDLAVKVERHDQSFLGLYDPRSDYEYSRCYEIGDNIIFALTGGHYDALRDFI